MTCVKELKISSCKEFYDEYLKDIRGHENRPPNNELAKNAIKLILPQNLGWRLGSDSYF